MVVGQVLAAIPDPPPVLDVVGEGPWLGRSFCCDLARSAVT